MPQVGHNSAVAWFVSAVLYCTEQCCAVQRSVVLCREVLCCTEKCCAVQRSVVLYIAAILEQIGPVQYSALHCITKGDFALAQCEIKSQSSTLNTVHRCRVFTPTI